MNSTASNVYQNAILTEEQIDALCVVGGNMSTLMAACQMQEVGDELQDLVQQIKAYPSTVKKLNRLLIRLANLTSKATTELARGMKLADV